MKIERNIQLAPLTTFGIGGKASYFCTVREVEDLKKAMDFVRKNKVPFFVLGGGSNILLSDKKFSGLVIKMELFGVEFIGERKKVTVIAAAGENWDALVGLCVEKGLGGIENLSGIPGTVGAAPVQNIGAYGAEFADCIKWVEVFDTKKEEVRKLTKKECKFGYRDSIFKKNPTRFIVVRVAFTLVRNGLVNLSYADVKEYFKKQKLDSQNIRDVRGAVLEIRSRKFPNLEFVGTAGSFFKNPVISKKKFNELRTQYPDLPGFPAEKNQIKVSLAWIIDHVCELKDLRIGDAGVSPNQTLVFCNFGNARSKDIHELAKKISEAVYEKIKIVIEPEVKLFF